MRLAPSLLALCAFLGSTYAELDSDGTSGSVDSLAPPGLQSLIAQANVLLSSGQSSDAARIYTQAIELSPSDYLLYFRRATAYFSVGRHAPALEDFDTVLQLTDNAFDKALLMKGKVFVKEGRWTEARSALKAYSKASGNAEKDSSDLLFDISEGELATKKAHSSRRSSNWPLCVDHATKALQSATHSVALRELRAECALAYGDVEQTTADLTRLTHVVTPTTAQLLRISNLSYYLTNPNSQPLGTLKQCLHFDPDSKPCRTAHRLLKNLEKELKRLDELEQATNWAGIIRLVAGESNGKLGLAHDFDAALDDGTANLDLPAAVIPRKHSPRRLRIYRAACKAYVSGGRVKKGEMWCEQTLEMDPKDESGLIGRGEVALAKEEWEAAVKAFEEAFEASGRNSNDAHTRLEKARRLLKQSRKKDYYKVLGVARDADARTIKKAYRKAAMKAHPDKGGSEQEMATVNEANEVLSNPELRARFDNGDDPNDLDSQRGGPGGGHPFFFQGGGGGPFGGGGFGGSNNFHFSFNH